MFIPYQECCVVVGLIIMLVTAAIPTRIMEVKYKDFVYLAALLCFCLGLYFTDWSQPLFTNPFITTP